MNGRVFLKDREISVIVALSPEERARGLMEAPWPPPVMAFPYRSAGLHSFWMKNTPSPLDIVFCKAGKIVDIKSGTPYSLKPIVPAEPSDLVIEFPRGTIRSMNADIGDVIYFKHV